MHNGYASSAGNSDTIDGYHASGLLTALSNSNNGISITVGGTTKSISNISVNHARNADSSDSASKVYGQLGDTGSHELVRCDMNNDQFRIIAGCSGNNKGWVEIATADDGNEPIYVRQYSGVFKSVVRTLTLLDANGHTYFPSYINIGGNENNNSSPDRVWGSNGSDNYLRSYRTSALNVNYAASAGNADTVDGEHASAFTRIVGRHEICTSGTAPYKYIHLFRIANSTGCSTLDCEIDFRTRYDSAKIEIRISTEQYPYNNGGSSISIVKKVVSGRTCNLWFLPTVQTSNYNYYDVYYESGAWNQGSYGITLKGNNGNLVFEHKGTNLTSLPDKVSPVSNNVAVSATKLQTPRTIWGQSFDGTGNVSGSLSEVGNIHFKADDSYDIGSDAAASRYIYTHWLGARSGRKLELGANNSAFGQGLCIDTNLNVGIGTNSPAYKLHVVGDIYSTANINVSKNAVIAGDLSVNGLISNKGILPANKKVNDKGPDCYVSADALCSGITAITDSIQVNQVTVQYSNNNGNSWTNYPMSNDAKFNLYANNTGLNVVYLGYNVITGNNDTEKLAQIKKNELIVSFYISNDCYTQTYFASVDMSDGTYTICTVEILNNSGTVIETYTKRMNGWNQLNYINLSNGNTGQGVGNDSRRYIRFKFKHDQNITVLRNAVINKIRIFSFTKYSFPTDRFMGHTGHIYNFDYNMNTYFPNSILAKGGVTAYQSSDIRLKTNITKLNCLNVIKSIGGTYEFDYIRDHKHSIGFIAQNVNNPLLKDIVAKDDNGYLKINYWNPKLISLAFGALTEIDDEVDKLKARVRELESEVEYLKNKDYALQ